MTDPQTDRLHTRSTFPTIVSWTVILLCVAFIILSQYMPQIRGKKPLRPGNELQLELLGKYLVGVKSFAPAATTQPGMSAAIDPQLDQISKSPRDAVAVAAIAGEVEGADRALTRLDHLAPATEPSIGQDIDSMRTIYRDSPAAIDSEQASALTDHYGFFGRLALVYGLPDSNPQREQVLAEGKRVVIVLVIWMIGMGVLLLAGIVLLIVAIVFRSTGRMQSRFIPFVAANTAYLEAFAIYLATFTLLPIPLAKLGLAEHWMLWTWPTILLVPITMWWAHRRGNSWRDVRYAYGWHVGRGWWIEAPLGLLGYITGLPIVVVGFIFTWILIRIAGATPTHPIINEVGGSGWHILGIYLLACVWAPVFEESMFRGALFAHLRRRWGWALSAFPVALIFASIHPQGWTTIPLLGSIALVLAALREWRGSIIASIVCHGCVNFVTMSLLVALKM